MQASMQRLNTEQPVLQSVLQSVLQPVLLAPAVQNISMLMNISSLKPYYSICLPLACGSLQ